MGPPKVTGFSNEWYDAQPAGWTPLRAPWLARGGTTLPARRNRTPAAKPGVPWAALRKLALSFPGMTEGTSYGEHAFLLDGKFFSRFNAKADGLVVYAEEELRDGLLGGQSDVYFTTDHYRAHPYVLVRLDRVLRAELAALLEMAFRAKARKKRVAEYDAKKTRR